MPTDSLTGPTAAGSSPLPFPNQVHKTAIADTAIAAVTNFLMPFDTSCRISVRQATGIELKKVKSMGFPFKVAARCIRITTSREASSIVRAHRMSRFSTRGEPRPSPVRSFAHARLVAANRAPHPGHGAVLPTRPRESPRRATVAAGTTLAIDPAGWIPEREQGHDAHIDIRDADRHGPDSGGIRSIPSFSLGETPHRGRRLSAPTPGAAGVRLRRATGPGRSRSGPLHSRLLFPAYPTRRCVPPCGDEGALLFLPHPRG